MQLLSEDYLEQDRRSQTLLAISYIIKYFNESSAYWNIYIFIS